MQDLTTEITLFRRYSFIYDLEQQPLTNTNFKKVKLV